MVGYACVLLVDKLVLLVHSLHLLAFVLLHPLILLHYLNIDFVDRLVHIDFHIVDMIDLVDRMDADRIRPHHNEQLVKQKDEMKMVNRMDKRKTCLE
jgi:hypothetical protein